MKNTTDSASEDKVGDIIQKQIIIAWDEGKPLPQTKKETGLPIEVVSRNLKKIQKILIERGVKGHGKESHF
jgi:ribose 5-phosphate isomerase